MCLFAFGKLFCDFYIYKLQHLSCHTSGYHQLKQVNGQFQLDFCISACKLLTLIMPSLTNPFTSHKCPY